MHVDQHTLSDMMAVINDRRRSLSAAALGAGDPVHRAECQRQATAQAKAIAKVTRSLARDRGNGIPVSLREIERYVDNLVDVYTGEIPDVAAVSNAIPKRAGTRGKQQSAATHM